MDWKQAASPAWHNDQSGCPVSDTSSTGRYSHKYRETYKQLGSGLLTYKLHYKIERYLFEIGLRASVSTDMSALGFKDKIQAYIHSRTMRKIFWVLKRHMKEALTENREKRSPATSATVSVWAQEGQASFQSWERFSFSDKQRHEMGFKAQAQPLSDMWDNLFVRGEINLTQTRHSKPLATLKNLDATFTKASFTEKRAWKQHSIAGLYLCWQSAVGSIQSCSEWQLIVDKNRQDLRARGRFFCFGPWLL